MPEIYDFPSEGRRAEDFFALKNPTASAGFEPADLGTKGQLATPRPPKPVYWTYHTFMSHLFNVHFNIIFVRSMSVKRISQEFSAKIYTPSCFYACNNILWLVWFMKLLVTLFSAKK